MARESVNVGARDPSDLRRTLPGRVASASGLQHHDAPPELDEVLAHEAGARVSLERHGGDVQQTVTLPLQQLVQLLLQEDLTHASNKCK